MTTDDDSTMKSHFFRRVAEGVELRLDGGVEHLLVIALAVLDDVGDPDEDPGAARLDVPVYLDSPDSNLEFDRLMRGELNEGRRADRQVVTEAIDRHRQGERRPVVTDEDAEALMRVLAEARLVVAARLGIEVAEDYESLDEGDAMLLDGLNVLQSDLIVALR